MTQYLGYFAGVLTVLSFIPQLARTWRTRQTGDLSFGMFAMLVASGLCWTAYGIVTDDRPVIWTNVGVVALNGSLLAAKLRFRWPSRIRDADRPTGA